MTVEMPRQLLRALFDAAVAAADPAQIVPHWLPAPPRGRTIVIGAGKASAAMAQAFDLAWPYPLEGIVVTRYGYSVPCPRIRVMEAAHPIPDEAGLAATGMLFNAVTGLTSEDLVVALISGGGSALLPAPPAGLTLSDEQALNRALLESGLGISDMNLLRRHVSNVKGGRLARAVGPAKLITLILSDIPGDHPAHVASGPTVPDVGSRSDALALLAQIGLTLPAAVRQHLESSLADAPLPSDPCFAGQEVHVIGSATLSLEAAQAICSAQYGVPAFILSDAIEGEAREIGRMHAALAREIILRDRPFTSPVVLLSGGETTVSLAGAQGRGGRNCEFALALALGLHGIDGIHGLAADTDGIDGSSESAGAFVDSGTVQRLRQAGLNPGALLARHDSWSAFARLDDLLNTGPTRTNVNDFRALLMAPSS